MIEDLSKLEEIIKYDFHDLTLLEQALTHSSYANEHMTGPHTDYERLEFLGDSVLEMISSRYLYDRYPTMPEGDMTKLRASLVCEPALALCARELGIDAYIRLGHGEESSGGRKRDSIISDVVEAIIGAMYLDGGIETASDFILERIMSHDDGHMVFADSKSELQIRAQARGRTVTYELIGESGPDHDKMFEVNCLIDGRVVASGRGKTKKSAQQAAASEALRSY